LQGRFWLILVLAATLTSCSEIVNYPAPAIRTVSPTSVTAGQPTFTITVTGSNFVPQSSVLWNGSTMVTFFATTNQLTATVPASYIQNPGTVEVAVFSPQPGGGTTPTTVEFDINPAVSPIPQITSVTPSEVFAGGATQTLFVAGSNFVTLSTVTVNGNNRETVFNNSQSLQAALTAQDIASSGTLQIVVLNPAPGGGSSNAVTLNITNAVPSITSVSPTSVQAGGTASTTLTVSGSSFVPDSVIYINGAPRTTTYSSSSSISVVLTPGDLASAGINQVWVFNPAPSGGTSNTLTFAVNATDTAGLPLLVDVAPDGTQASNGICGGLVNCQNGTFGLTLENSGPSVSTKGEFIAFASISDNLVTGQTNGSSDIFFRDTCLGAASCSPVTNSISVAPNRAASNGPSSEPSLDNAADYAAFTSLATNLVTSVTVPPSVRQIYWAPVCHTAAGCKTSTTTPTQLVSISADGLSAGNGDSYNPVISPDGRYVAFVSLATNLVSGLTTLDGHTPQVFVSDLSDCATTTVSTTACVPTTYLVSTPDGTTPGNAASLYPSISNTGLYVSFASSATNLGATAPNPSGSQEIFVRYTCVTSLGSTTSSCTPFTDLVSTPDGVTPADGASSQSEIADNTGTNGGLFIAFASTATNLIAGVGPTQQIYMRNTCVSITTTCTPTTLLVSTPDGVTPSNAPSENPSLSQTGQFVAFATKASNLASNTANGIENVFVRNTCQGFTTTTTTSCLTSTVLASQPGGAAPLPSNGDSIAPAISSDGKTVSFISFASNLVAGDTDGLEDLFLAATSF